MKGTIKVTKHFNWDCAHLLEGHEGLCKNLHGHTYKLEVDIIAGSVIKTGPSAGMIIDFSDLKQIVKTQIVDMFDHACVVNTMTQDPFEVELTELLYRHGKKVLPLPFRTTAENMAKWIAIVVDEHFEELTVGEARVSEVRLWETPTSVATYTTDFSSN